MSLFKNVSYFENKESELFAGIGKEIVKTCDGLPLAAKTRGSPMQYMKTKEEWQNILDSKVWRLEVEQHVFQSLLLSYYDLNPAVDG